MPKYALGLGWVQGIKLVVVVTNHPLNFDAMVAADTAAAKSNNLGRSLRSRIQVCPKALAKFSRLTGRRKLIFRLAPGKLRCTASLVWSKWVKIAIFSKKMLKKTVFFSHMILDHLTLERDSTHNFKDYDLFRGSFEKYGT